METLKSLLSPFISMISVMFSIFYIYAILGMIFFGGKIDFENEAIRNNDATPDIWALNNFNDFANSYLVLFELIIVNNWMITAEMCVQVLDTKWVLLYFVSFYIIGVLVGMNILVCFAIDMYQSIGRLDNEQSAHEQKLYDLAQEVKRSKYQGEVSGGSDLRKDLVTNGMRSHAAGAHVTLLSEADNVDEDDDVGVVIYRDQSFSVR